MSDDLKVDWGRPIEAVHEDGRVVAVHSCEPDKDGDRKVIPVLDGYYDLFLPDGRSWSDGPWRIRNVAEVNGNSRAPSDNLAKRMEALVRRIADEEHFSDSAEARAVTREARAIVALLPEPVDADEAEIDRLMADFKALGATMTKGQRARSLASAALARGRALERDSREG